jgi:hypothetical protein
VCVRTRFWAIRWNEMPESPVPKGRPNLAQRRGPQHARFWRDGVERFSAGKSGKKDSSPGGVCVITSLSPLRGLLNSHLPPTACAVGCILTPLPGWGTGRALHFVRHKRAMTQTPEGRPSSHAHTSALRQRLVLNAAALLICDSHDLTSHTALSDGVATVRP